MRNIFGKKKAIFTGHVRDKNPLEVLSDSEVSKLVKDISCKHESYCMNLGNMDKAHCSKDYAMNCAASKFYNQYGENWNHMGVGS